MTKSKKPCYDVFVSLPNILTAIRFLLAIIGVVALLWEPFPHRYLIATGLFIIAALTDWLDGSIARRKQLTSELGAFIDPLADKLLVLSYFAVLTVDGFYVTWLFLAVLARDLINDGYRSFAASRRMVVGANQWSKIKTMLQMLSLTIILLGLTLPSYSPISSKWSIYIAQAAEGIMILALIFGIIGTVQFMRRYSFILRSGE